MVQFGYPTNTGKGGESVWGGYFDDEIKDDLKHDSRVSLSCFFLLLGVCLLTCLYIGRFSNG